ncbi:MAG TPA: sigma-54 dependent transcriptional regulator [Pirellulales bacterium]|nr:sigma-54 dependent transcriptional regulator [Pirellulales bacterium]
MSTLLVIDDDLAIVQVFSRVFRDSDVAVLGAACAAEGLAQVEAADPDMVVLDVVLPDASGLETFQRIQGHDARLPVLVITAKDDSDTAIEAMNLGAFDYLCKPLDFPRVRELVAKALEVRRLMRVPVLLPDAARALPMRSDVLVGRCPAMQELYKAVGRVASQNTMVLVRGESGTGKELIARAIYQHSARKQGKFLAVNCAAIPEPLLESELFGHEKGSFTGADARKIGKFEQCSGGTLFLDEIGDMTPLSQSKVLRVLQEQRFERVGGRQTIATDVRIIAATNRDLEPMVADGRFRADLYYRLNGFTINVPPLRERGDDILLLVRHYLACYNRDLGKAVDDVSAEAEAMLLRYGWPGNVRELQSVLRQSLLQAMGSVLLADFLPSAVRARPAKAGGAVTSHGGPARLETLIDEQLNEGRGGLYAEALACMESLLLTRVIKHARGNQSLAAKLLGISRSSVRNKLRQLHIIFDPTAGIEEEPVEEHSAEQDTAEQDAVLPLRTGGR